MDLTAIQGFGALQQETKKTSSSTDAKGMFGQLLQQKLDHLKEDLEQMEQRRQELEELKKAQEELTGKSDGESSSMAMTETLQRFLPDGTILVTTTKDGEVVEQYRKKPHLVPVPDPAVPKPEEGGITSEQVKWIPHYSIMELLSVK